ncbi:MAG: hypothetical protein J0L78_01130 [Planctomycetes bacterium]|nr:hypothetical protein [Planctomycetota bacterium]
MTYNTKWGSRGAGLPLDRKLAMALGIFACAGAGGCYERVVRAEGLGAQGIAVQKPYRSETSLDKAVDNGFGTPSSNSTSAPRAPTAPRAPR